MLLLNISTAFADGNNQPLDVLLNEPPVVRGWLISAHDLLAQDSLDSTWQAANLFCKATRAGSSQAAYRLGMLYAAGQGVPASREYAASLFNIAAHHGHYQAQTMLETVAIISTKLPKCVTQNVLPSKAKPKPPIGEIDSKIANLPARKRWVITLAEQVAGWYSIDPKLVLSVIAVESNFKHKAVSNKQAQGLMQLIPATAERFNVKNAYDATQNIKGGVKYLRWLLSYFRGDVTLAIAAYNAGEGSVNRYKGIPPYKETQQYVKKVMRLYGKKRHDYDVSLTHASPVI